MRKARERERGESPTAISDICTLSPLSFSPNVVTQLSIGGGGSCDGPSADARRCRRRRRPAAVGARSPEESRPVRVCVRGAVRQLLSRVRRVNSVRGKGDNSEAVEGKQFV